MFVHRFLFCGLIVCSVNLATSVAQSQPSSDPSSQSSTRTYHNQISRLINRHCARCHREGGVGPFALDTYNDLTAHSAMVRAVVQGGTMPPWFAAKSDPSKASPWANDASLTPTEQQDLVDWIDAGHPLGNIADAPEPRAVEGVWQIGQPDLILEFPQAIAIQATGVMPYKHVVINTQFPQDRWVQAVEVLPGDSSVVHHALVLLGESGKQPEDTVNYWAGYAPGNGARTYPSDYARRLPKGASLVFQMHYTPNGKATQDKTRIGFRFAESKPKFEVRTASVLNTQFAIPPRAKNYQVESTLRVPKDIRVLGYLAHHHLRGAAARYELADHSGRSETLLDIPDYDFNWQLFYRYSDPPVLKQGSTIRYTAWYDNSQDNPANPNPNVTVRWGPQTHHEMHIGYVEYAIETF